jgi:NAD(P)H-dependent FMN reductase
VTTYNSYLRAEEVLDRLDQLPLFSEDKAHSAPAAITDLRARVRTADAVLIATRRGARRRSGTA